MFTSTVMPWFPGFEDNQGAVQLAQNPVTNSNSKHIDVRHHFLRELVRQRDIKVVQVPSEFQHADIFTKALAYNLCCVSPKMPDESEVLSRLLIGNQVCRVTFECLSSEYSVYVCMYICMVRTYSRVWINRVRLPIRLVVS